MIDPNSLINTPHYPPYTKTVRGLARQAKAYYALKPYPNHSPMTLNWLSEGRGPFPRCRPLPQTIVNKFATWLFGKPITFRIPPEEGQEEGEAQKNQSKLINDVWTQNDMSTKARVLAICGSNAGGCFVRWSIDETRDEKPIQIDLLDPTEQAYLYWSEDDAKTLLMARIQYPYFDYKSGKWTWKREEWTDELHVTYKDVPAPLISQATDWTDPYTLIDKVEEYKGWEIADRKANDFGVIPGWLIKNRDVGGATGEGDLWSMFELIDQINFTRDIGHKDNQKSIDPDRAYIDLDAKAGDQPTADGPDKVEVLESTNAKGDGHQGKIETFQTNAALRPYLDDFAKDLKHEVLNAIGSVEFDPSEVTNKGNLTSAVMTQMYAPLIERIDEKRQCVGEDGLCVFFERMSEGMTNAKAKGWSVIEDVQIVWSPYFNESEEEKLARVSRVAQEIEANLTTHERGVKEIAAADNVMDVDALLAEVQKQKKEAEAKEAKENDLMSSAMNRQRAGLGGKEK